ncbi:hypothetical protein Ahy_A06g029531 [Arachis hypogaea]|uniref:non-specific serine/threonine protein kinase n=1 Tax=Arachis hypogaea TaxID=3818 RepID=A0A445CTG0_ARAHY|nr:hypothetical protein Ahy_A06g029531 [Arachis hypogaea]
MLSQIHHKNIFKHYGLCLHHRFMFLVYEYMERGSLFYALNMDDKEAKECCWSKKFTSLTSFHLSNNQFGGNIPLEIGILDSLCNVNLSNNKLEGLIPSPMLNYINFGEVDLSNNLLSGYIPSKIGYVKKLDMSHNLLSSSVPFFLDLSYNNLTRNLHVELASIPRINLSFNFFECLQGCKDFFAKSLIGNNLMSVNSSVQDQNTKKSNHLVIIALPISCFFLIVILWVYFVLFDALRRDLFSILNYDGKIVFEDIIKATQDFDIRYCIETSIYDYVYRAQLSNDKIFALKKLH